MSALLVVGAGGHGRVLADVAMCTQRWSHIAFADDRGSALGKPLGLEVVGTCAELSRLAAQFDAVAVGIGNAIVRMRLLTQLAASGRQLPVIAHPTAYVSQFARLGAGTVVFPQAAINAGAVLGVGCIVNTAATVDHDCQLADAVHVCPGAHLAGDVHIGLRCWIGVGACVREGVRIGDDACVGAGAAVVAHVPSAVTVMGVPARQRASGPVQS
jgi:sugar O-acyltransferase (sialic acid O-acetyltransferase NeuD family)